jgi:hypothetical protein
MLRGLRVDNAAMIHSRSMRPAMSSCVGIPEYRPHATFELFATTTETSNTASSEDSDGWAGAWAHTTIPSTALTPMGRTMTLHVNAFT